MSEARKMAPLSAAQWLLLMVLAAVQFTNVLDFMIVMPLGPQYMRQLGISTQQFGLIVSAYAYSAGLSGLLAAWFLDRFDRRTSLLILYGGFATGTLVCAYAPDYVSLLLGRIVTGAFGGVLGAAVLTIIGDAFPEQQRGRATGTVMAAFSLASIAGIPCGLYLAQHLGWWAPFGVLGCISIGILGMARFLLPAMRGHLERRERHMTSTLAVLLEPAHLRAYLLMAVLVLATFAIVPYIAAYMVANVGRAESELPYVYITGGICTLIAMPLVGRLADRYGKLSIFRICAFIAIIPVLILTNLPTVPLALSLVVSTFFMLATSGRMVPAMALIMSSVQPRYRGSFMSINSSVQQVAAGAAAMLGGLLLQKGDDGTLTGFPLIGVLATCAMLLSIYLAGRLRSGAIEPAEAPSVVLPARLVPVLVPAEDEPALPGAHVETF